MLIYLLLDKGTSYFVCIGDLSEQLHDQIDEIIYQYDEEHDFKLSGNIVTTYHADDAIDDAVNFYIYGTELRDKERGYLIAILDKNMIEDREILFWLEKS